MILRAKPLFLVLLLGPFATAAVVLAQEPHFGAMRFDRGTEHRLCDLVSVHLSLKLDERARTFEGRVTNRMIPLRERVAGMAGAGLAPRRAGQCAGL